MWNLKRINFSNLFSHKNSYYEFKNGKCVVIFGKNITDKNLESNGAGKTTLFEAICIALTNESLRGLRKDDFINRESEDCKIVLQLENNSLKMSLRIERHFFRNKSTKIELYENDKINSQITSVAEANKRVFELIGISRDDLLRYFIISQDNHYTFFTASDGDKKEIMNRITSANMINPVLEELSLRLKEKEAEYKIVSDELNELSTRKEILEEQAEELGKQDNKEEINELKEKISEAESQVEESERLLRKYQESIKTRESQMKEIIVKDVSDLKKKRKDLKNEIEELESELEDVKLIRKKCNNVIEGVIVCPNCGEEITEENELELSAKEARDLLKEADNNIPKIQKKIETNRNKLKKVKGEIDEAEKAEELLSDLEDEKNSYDRNAKRKAQEIKELKADIAKWETEIYSLKNKKKDNKQLQKILSQISECDKGIDKKSEEVTKYSKDIEMIRFWQFHMGKNGFYTYLANKSIKIIEGTTNSFLRKFGVDISISMNGYKILRSGEVREKIDIFVLNDGITAEPFLSKSGGERGRVTLAGILGIQHLINMSADGGGLNFLALDEVFPGIDSMGQEKIIKVLEKMGITVMMITQNVNESFNNENTLYVVKEKDESRYVENLQSY